MQQHSEADGKAGNAGVSYSFGPFHLFPERRLLLEGDAPVAIGTRALDLLVALVRSNGEVVGKADLLAYAWPGLTVEESNLRVHITAVRKALGDGQDGRRFIVNTPGRGYSFVAPVLRRDIDSPAWDGPTDGPVGNLPLALRSIIGRDHFVASMAAQLPQRRLITITGSGGIGKTTTALTIANELRSSYHDGAYLIDLAPVTAESLVPSVLSTAVGLPVSSGAPIPDIVHALRAKHMLLLLDNCEHVVESAAILAEEVYRNCPNIHILATSRQPLRVTGEYVQRLPSLELPPPVPRLTAAYALTFGAVRLFAERAAALVNTFALTDANAPSVVMICRRLDGIALAIELAAARVDALGVSGVADALDDRFRLLKLGPRDAPLRQKTLKATFDWSYDLLPETTRTVLRRLAVFPKQFGLASAAAVITDVQVSGADVAEELTTLVSTSLVSADLTADPVIYRLPESTRAYALQHVMEMPERNRLFRRHAEHVLSLLREAEAVSSRWSIARWVHAHGHRLDDARAALDWAFSDGGDRQLGIDLTIAAVPLWERLSLSEECRSRVEIALAALPSDDDRWHQRRMQLSAALGSALTLRSDTASTAAWKSALETAEEIGDREYALRSLRGLWRNHFIAGKLSDATYYAEKFTETAGRSGDETLERVSEYMKGMNSFYQGDLNEARIHIGQAMRAADQTPFTSDVPQFSLEHTVVASANLSKILWLQGHPDEAVRMTERSLKLAGSTGHGLSLAYALAWCECRIADLTGDLDRLEHCLHRLGEHAAWDSLGQWDVIRRCWTGVLRGRRGDLEEKVDLLSLALQEIPEGSFRLHHTSFLGEYALASAMMGRQRQAEDAIERAISLCDRQNERWFYPELLRFKGEIVLRAGRAEAAALAEEHFRSSIGWARRQGALSWELRSAMSLARSQRSSGRIGLAHDLLAPVYGRFREGFETRDLKSARALLDDLASSLTVVA